MTLFAAGITITASGSGAFVVIEKIPRKIERVRESTFNGVREIDPIFECAFRFVGAEHLSGGVPASVARVCARLRAEPLLDDTTSRLDIGAFGRPVLELSRARQVNPWATLVTGDKEATDPHGTTTLPLTGLQATATLMFETERVQVSETLLEGPSLMHSLEKLEALPPSGPARDLGIAAAIALHSAARSGGGSWVSTKPKPEAMCEAEAVERWRREARRAAVKHARRKSGW